MAKRNPFMNRIFKKYYFDFIPLIIILISSIVSIWTMVESNINILWQHYLGIVCILITVFLLIKNHQLGIIFLGVTLFLSLLTIISFNVGIVTNYLSLTSARIPIFYGNALSLVWLILHLILSFRYYVGISTKKYWQQLIKRVNA
jgi:hypothetical protein